MKKKLLLGLFFCLGLVFSMESAHAMRPYEFASRNECEHIELALAKADGTLVKKACYDDYKTAKKKMDKSTNTDLVLIENGVIIDAKYAVIDYDQDFSNASTKYVRVYAEASGKNEISYIRVPGTYPTYPDDAVLLDYNYDTKRVKIKVSGLVGWIDKYDNTAILYDIVPLVWAKTPQYYVVTSDKLVHYFPKSVYEENMSTAQPLTIDVKPEMLNAGTYYSYDGHYFYTDMKTLIDDYKNNIYEHSVNKDKVYYNYYQFLSYRTKTSYNADNINAYINFRTGNNTNSKLYNTGQDFINTQEKYGVNAILLLIVGINESGSGTSRIAQDKNNLFGLGAVDSDPYNSAEVFNTVSECIDRYGYKWLTYGFLQPGDWRFRGAVLGNKAVGLNVKYASDPYWGETAAHYYYEFDKRYGFQDRNSYLLAVNNKTGVYPKKSVGGEKVYYDYYVYNNLDSTVVVLETIKDTNGNLWYKIQSDPNLDVNSNYIGSSTNPVAYNWNSYVYVEAKDYTIIASPDNYNPEVINEEPKPNPTPTPTPSPTPTPTPTPKPSAKPISTIVTNAKYKYSSGIVSGINLGTKINNLVNSLIKQGAASVVIKDAGGNVKETGTLVTGDKVEITTDKLEVLEVVIHGDINGDGNIDKTDCAEVLRQYYGYTKYDNYKKNASDTNGDGKIDKLDASEILRQFYGYANIKQ